MDEPEIGGQEVESAKVIQTETDLRDYTLRSELDLIQQQMRKLGNAVARLEESQTRLEFGQFDILKKINELLDLTNKDVEP